MNTTDPRVEARARANRRLRRMTIGTTAFGIAATGALGWAAAVTYDGSSTPDTSVALVSDVDTGTSSTAAATPSPTATTSGTSSSSASTATTPSVTGSSGSAHASTGGS